MAKQEAPPHVQSGLSAGRSSTSWNQWLFVGPPGVEVAVIALGSQCLNLLYGDAIDGLVIL